MIGSVLVVEAPGKVNAVRRILRDMGRDDYVVATGGRLFDLPRDRLGISDDLQLKYEACSQDRIDYITKILSQAKHVFIMTDDDHEGELIAHHVRTLSKSPEFIRLRCHSITKSGVKAAFDSPGKIDEQMVAGAINRRAFDRICGYVLSLRHSNQENGGVVGRVASPLLDELGKEHCEPLSILSFPVMTSVGPVVCSATISSDAQVLPLDLRNFVNGLGVLDAKKGLVTSPTVSIKALDAYDATIMIAERTGASIQQCSDSLQRLYESGKISYPRTDSDNLSAEAIETIRRISSERGDTVGKSDIKKGKISAHDALHVTDLMDIGLSDFKTLTLDEQSWLLIYRNNVSQCKNIVCENQVVTVDHPSLRWMTDKPGVSLSFTKSRTYEVGFKNEQHLDPKAGLCPELARGWVCGIDLSRFVAENMKRLAIGRPSTIAYHAHKIADHYLKANGTLNFLGRSSISRAKEIAPMILSLDKIHAVDRMLLQGNDIKTTLHKVFQEIDIREEFFFSKPREGRAGSVSKEKSISYE